MFIPANYSTRLIRAVPHLFYMCHNVVHGSCKNTHSGDMDQRSEEQR